MCISLVVGRHFGGGRRPKAVDALAAIQKIKEAGLQASDASEPEPDTAASEPQREDLSAWLTGIGLGQHSRARVAVRVRGSRAPSVWSR